MPNLFPTPLKAGDKIAIVSTARKISPEEIQPAVDILKGWGLNVIIGSTIGKEDFQFAGTDEERIADMQAVLDDDSIRAILCARGGYGTARIIDDLDFRRFLKKPKWICGFSDITVIHSHLQSMFNSKSLHCSMAFEFPTVTPETLETMKRVLFGYKPKYDLPAHELNRAGEGEGILCGGNLSLLYSLSGSASDIDTTDKILFLEDIGEYLYHVDRMMVQLKRAGKLENLKGLIVGHFTDITDYKTAKPFGKTAYEIIADAVSEYDFPVCYGFPAGHEADNRALIMGEKLKLKVGDEGVKVSFS